MGVLDNSKFRKVVFGDCGRTQDVDFLLATWISYLNTLRMLEELLLGDWI
jgi:hypothetical protein